MRTAKSTQVVQQVIDEVYCNACGRKTSRDTALMVDYKGQYGSEVLEDLTTYQFDLCESCLKQLFNTFVIPVKKIDRMIL